MLKQNIFNLNIRGLKLVKISQRFKFIKQINLFSFMLCWLGKVATVVFVVVCGFYSSLALIFPII